MKILTIFTGGTIGTIQGDNYSIDVYDKTPEMLMERYARSAGDDVEFISRTPFFKLSESITPKELTELVSCVEKNLGEGYAGVLILHGTDTMAYTASTLSFALSHLDVPVVLTGANYPIDDRRSNGFRNFVASIDFIKDQYAPKSGTFVVFENNHDRRCLVHLGSRILQAEAFNDEFSSLGGVYYGEMTGTKFRRLEDRVNPSNAELKTPRPQRLKKVPLTFADDVLALFPYPGLRYDQFHDLVDNKKIKAVVHGMHHSGTATVRKEEESPYCLAQFIERCAKSGIPVYSCPSREKLMVEKYITSHDLLDAGIRPIENISMPAALTKIMLAYGNFEHQNEIDYFLKEEINFEFVDFRRAGYGKHRRNR